MSADKGTTWRYLLARENVDGDDLFTVREVYEDAGGNLSWTADPITPIGETWHEIVNDLALMSGAPNGPVLDLTLDPPTLVQPREVKR